MDFLKICFLMFPISSISTEGLIAFNVARFGLGDIVDERDFRTVKYNRVKARAYCFHGALEGVGWSAFRKNRELIFVAK